MKHANKNKKAADSQNVRPCSLGWAIDSSEGIRYFAKREDAEAAFKKASGSQNADKKRKLAMSITGAGREAILATKGERVPETRMFETPYGKKSEAVLTEALNAYVILPEIKQQRDELREQLAGEKL